MVSDRGDRGLFTVWTCSFWLKILFPFPLVTAKWIGNYFDNKRCGSNKTCLLITRQFIGAPNLRSVKRDAARTRKKSAGSWFTLRIRSASPLTQGTSMLHCIIVCTASFNVKVIAYTFCWREQRWKYVFLWKMACSKWKWKSIATVPDPDLCPTTVNILAHLISRYQLLLKANILEAYGFTEGLPKVRWGSLSLNSRTHFWQETMHTINKCLWLCLCPRRS